MKEYLMIGQVIKPQGVRGEIKVLPLTDDPERFLDLARVFLDERGGEALAVRAARTREGYAYLCLAGVEDRDAAEALRGRELFVPRAEAAPLPEGRYYIADLIGMQVVDEAGRELGRLADVMQAGGNDVYEVRGKRTFRFPALKRALRAVDVEGARMELDSAALTELAVYDDAD